MAAEQTSPREVPVWPMGDDPPKFKYTWRVYITDDQYDSLLRDSEVIAFKATSIAGLGTQYLVSYHTLTDTLRVVQLDGDNAVETWNYPAEDFQENPIFAGINVQTELLKAMCIGKVTDIARVRKETSAMSRATTDVFEKLTETNRGAAALYRAATDCSNRASADFQKAGADCRATSEIYKEIQQIYEDSKSNQ